MSTVGTKNANNIVSISNDSKVCQWNCGELNAPKIAFNMFNHNQQANHSSSQNEQFNVRINSLEFPEDETDKFFVGAEDNNIYQGTMHSAAARDREQIQWRTFRGHMAPITSIAMHPGKSMSDSKANAGVLADMSELMLSSSMDWTMKLWYPKNQFKDTPIYTFESSQEYIYDVKWSPVHPSIFAAVDGDGYIDLWDINKDVEAPIARKKVNGSTN